MALQIRWISLLLRRKDSAREGVRILRSFEDWRQAQQALPPPQRPHDGGSRPKLIVIRLDDIGDYLLFRNQLPSYRASARWKNHHITLLGNESWREIFDAVDSRAVDDVIWVNKAEALTSPAYRLELWQRLRARGFETVIAPSRTRPLVLDDLCTLAAAPERAIGAVNTYMHQAWNRVSDGFYQELFQPANARVHEFSFNGEFAAWCCGTRFDGARPQLDLPAESAAGQTPWARPGDAPVTPYIVCFVGATTRSKRWPVGRWIEFIELYQRACLGHVVVAGNSRREIQAAALIEARTGAHSIAGRVSLLELCRCVAGARGVVSNDTMAAHLGVSCNRPTVIVANGVNYERFTDYAEAGIAGVATVYPGVFTRRRKRLGDVPYHYPQAVSGDMASIRALEVLDALKPVMMRSTGKAPPITAVPRVERVCAVCVTFHPDSTLPDRVAKVLPQVCRLVIVDNGSTAEARRMLGDVDKDSRVTVILCKQNLGIARAQNIGIEFAMGLASDFALLLDQDTCVNEDLVPVLTRIHRSHPNRDRLAIVGAGYAGSQQVPRHAIAPQEDYEEVQAVIGSGSLLSLEAFRHIGTLREEFFIDHVDTEYCARAWNKGYLVVKARQSLMVHKIGSPARQRFLWMTKPTRNHSADRLYYQARNDTVMLRESGEYRAGLWRLKALNRAIRSCRRVMMFEHHKSAKVFGILQGWCDGVRGQLGPRFSTRKFI